MVFFTRSPTSLSTPQAEVAVGLAQKIRGNLRDFLDGANNRRPRPREVVSIGHGNAGQENCPMNDSFATNSLAPRFLPYRQTASALFALLAWRDTRQIECREAGIIPCSKVCEFEIVVHQPVRLVFRSTIRHLDSMRVDGPQGNLSQAQSEIDRPRVQGSDGFGTSPGRSVPWQLASRQNWRHQSGP